MTLTALDRLAVFGGPPAFAEPLHVGRPTIGDRDAVLRRVAGVLDRRWLTNDGPLVAEFEARVAALAGTAHCVAVSSGTVGLQLVARGLDLHGEVVMPSFTFVGTAHALSWIGLTPRFCEIDPARHTIDAAAAEAAITPETSAIVGVHLWGRPCDVDGLEAVAERHGVALVLDAAQAFGCGYGGRPVGGRGRAEVFSFHATKVVGAGEGGAITTDDGALADRLRLLRNFGFRGYDTVHGLGTNGKLSEISAAVGLGSMEALERTIAVNRRNHDAYADQLDGIPGLRLSERRDPGRHTYHYVVAETGPEVDRDDLVTVLHAENVLARRYFFPGCHRHRPYRDEAPALAVTDAVAGRVLVLPTGEAVDPAAIGRIAGVLRVACEAGPELGRRLREQKIGASPDALARHP